jgi:site-specific DNA-methyltransferase (adenine-specific)
LRIERIGNATLYQGDCRETLPLLPKVGAVITDPPYPNNAGHFLEGIDAAREFCTVFSASHWIVFWTEIETPPVPLPLVAVHVWHRTNTNRPDNYEPAFEFHSDGRKRASRVYPYCVILPGLTGIVASGHPTEKHAGLMAELVNKTGGVVLDPFMGSGSTGVACARLRRPFIGVECDPKWFDIACRRIEDAQRQESLFEHEAAPMKPPAPAATPAAGGLLSTGPDAATSTAGIPGDRDSASPLLGYEAGSSRR